MLAANPISLTIASWFVAMVKLIFLCFVGFPLSWEPGLIPRVGDVIRHERLVAGDHHLDMIQPISRVLVELDIEVFVTTMDHSTDLTTTGQTYR